MCGSDTDVIQKIRFYNLYGLTEQSVWSTMYLIPADTIIRYRPSSSPVKPKNLPISSLPITTMKHTQKKDLIKKKP